MRRAVASAGASHISTELVRLLVRPTLIERAIALWVFLAVAVCAKTLVQPHEHTVYPIFAQAARDWWNGAPLYANHAYFYSPTFAVAMSVFAWLPDQIGGIAWQLVSIGALLAALRLFYRQFLAQPFAARWEPLYLTLCLIASVRGIWSAQSNTLLLASLLLATVAAARGRWWSAALCLAVPVHIKLWPIAFAALLCARWPRKLAPRFVTIVLALAIMPLLAAAPDQAVACYGDWYEALAARQNTGLRFPGYRDAWTIADALGIAVQKPTEFRVQIAGGLTVLVWTLWLSRRRIPLTQTHVLTLAAWAAWQVLFGPGSERLAYLLLAPTMSWAMLQAFQERRGRTLVVCAYAAAFVLGSGAVERSLTPLFSWAMIVQPSGVVMFVVWLVVYGPRSSVLQAQEEVAGEVFAYRIARDRPRFSIRTHDDVAISPPTRLTSHSASRYPEQEATL